MTRESKGRPASIGATLRLDLVIAVAETVDVDSDEHFL